MWMPKCLVLVALSGCITCLAAAEPCGGKKGGIAFCNLEGYFVCNDGTVSQSRRVCVTDENANSELVNTRLRESDLAPIDFRNQGGNQFIFNY